MSSIPPAPPVAPAGRRFRQLAFRSLRCACPCCGRGKLFYRWLRMHTQCPSCGVTFEREAGFFLGSIYVNYGLTALIVATGYPYLLFQRQVEETPLLIGSLVFCLLFPVFFFPFARSFWMGFDEFCDPRCGGDPIATGQAVAESAQTKHPDDA